MWTCLDLQPIPGRAPVALCAITLAATSLLAASIAVAGGAPPFTRTEQRAACTNNNPLRQPFFGELHLHTQYSADAATLETRNTPRDAYLFAKGQKVGLPPFVDTRTSDTPPPTPSTAPTVSSHPYCLPGERCQYTATRTIQLPPGRQLDFAAITDHVEQLGETNICFWEEAFPCQGNRQCPWGQFCLGVGPVIGQDKGKCVPEGYTSADCVLAREEVTKLRAGLGTTLFSTEVTAENPTRLQLCGPKGRNCIFQARNVWQQIIADAEAAYDKTAACTFTSFVAYEYTATPTMGQCAILDGSGNDVGGSHAPCWQTADCSVSGEQCATAKGANNLHRNIIFRNASVPIQPISYVETPTGCGQGSDCQHGGVLASPVQMLKDLERRCLRNPRTPNCDFISIPHNSNLSGGAMFLIPETLDVSTQLSEAQTRAAFEPLVELMQIKGQSECRFSSRKPGAWNTPDELCDFENMSFGRLSGQYLTDPDASSVLPQSYVRNALKSGLQFQQQHGINPFQLGFVGGLDNHNGTPGASDTVQYAKTGAHGDQSFSVSGQILNETNFLGLETSGGGLTVVWAEENSRDSLFTAMKRRETYATSSTRPIVRFFGGFTLPPDICTNGDFAKKGYANGVPMGGILQGPAASAPKFAIAATMDPGWPGHPGTQLQRAQIVKGWVDASGQTHETVYDVAGNPNNGASVDLRTCAPVGSGASDLCAVWTDPAFDPSQRAFYYSRVLENPSCRWNQFYCNARGIDCSQPVGTCSTGGTCNSDADCPQGEICSPPPSYTQFEYQQCCSNAVPKTVQQRAWTSPIWYTP